MISTFITVAVAVLWGVLVGWWGRGRYAPLPDSWAILCADRASAARAWVTGTTIVRLDRYGIRYLSAEEVQDALADRMRGSAPPRPWTERPRA